jgi:hypothetical protein
MRSSPSPSPAPGDELRHTAAPEEEWVFTAWAAQPAVGVISGYRIVGGSGWYWAALARAGEPLLHVADWHVPLRSDPLLVKGDGLWAEHTCDAPMEQWTVANETYAVALDDPADALGRGYGIPAAVAFDLEWYATTAPERLADGYRQPGEVHGVIELAHGRLDLAGAPADRAHRWADVLAPPVVEPGLAHVGLRAPAQLPDGALVDLVLTTDGWRARVPRSLP